MDGLYCCICFMGLTYDTCVVDSDGERWDVCKGKCADDAGVRVEPNAEDTKWHVERYGEPHKWAQSWWPEAWWLIHTVGFDIAKECPTCGYKVNAVCSSYWHQGTHDGKRSTLDIGIDRPAAA